MRTRLGLALLPVLVLAIAWPDPSAAASPNQRQIDALRSLTRNDRVAERPARTRVTISRLPLCTRHAWWRGSPAALRLRIEQSSQDASALQGVPPTLLRAVIRIESNYDPDAVSHAGAQGLMQLMPGTAKELGVVCPFDPRENVFAGTRYLQHLHERFGNWPDALAAYNAGPERVARRERLPKETQRYVRNVLARAPIVGIVRWPAEP